VRWGLVIALLVGCAHTRPSDGRLELARARVAVARGKPHEAIVLYQQVPKFSAAWPRAVFEGGRERARTNHYSQALGLFLTLRAPQLADWVFPEAYALEAEIYLNNCYHEKPLAIARELRAKVLPLRERVTALVGGAPIGNEVPQIATRLAGALTDAERWERVDQLLVELDLAESVLAGVEEAVAEQRARLVDNGGQRVEVIMIVTDDHHNWKFDGEFWPDELGNYRVPILSRCQRRQRI
jgi:hypothetical protein